MQLLVNTFVILFLFHVSAFSEPWYPLGKSNAKTVYRHKADCEISESHVCKDLKGVPYTDAKEDENGEIIVDAGKVKEREDKQAAEDAIKDDRKRALKDCAKLSNAKLEEVAECMVLIIEEMGKDK